MTNRLGDAIDYEPQNIVFVVMQVHDGMLTVKVPQWDQGVFFLPLYLIPISLREGVHPRAIYFAKARLCNERTVEIIDMDCRLAPDLDPNDGLTPPEGDNLVRLS